jgi:hypothetical protein
MTGHDFVPCNPTDPIDRGFCAICGHHLNTHPDDVPLPPEPPEEPW